MGQLIGYALLYDAQGRYSEAEPLYKRALAIREHALGPEHPKGIIVRKSDEALLKKTNQCGT